MISLDESQQSAVEGAAALGLSIITGGAGTGKTTLIAELTRYLIKYGHEPILMAPTGKAAARLKEATGYQAHTIHRELGWNGSIFMRRHADNLRGPVIIDEASMVDSWLMARLLEYKPPQLILVGDRAQLPPVGKGQPFHDLITLCPDQTWTLTTCYRASGAIHKASQMIRDGDIPRQSFRGGGESWTVRETKNIHKSQALIEQWTRDGLMDFTHDVILAPQYGDPEKNDGGIHAINRAVKAIVNPSLKGETWSGGDRVMNTQNFAQADYWNGDIGTVIGSGMRDRYLQVELDRRPGEPIEIDADKRKHLIHAYCLSVHKSQGSQFRRVIFLCHYRHSHMLTRELIYTAITRAQEGVCVLGEFGAMRKGLEILSHKTTVLQVLAKQRGGADL